MGRFFTALRTTCVVLAFTISAHAVERQRPLSLPQALQSALAANPRLIAAQRDIGIASGLRIQSGALPNPEASFELDNALGSGPYRGTRSAETNLQLSQLVELGGKREARIAAGEAGVGSAVSETAIAFLLLFMSLSSMADALLVFSGVPLALTGGIISSTILTLLVLPALYLLFRPEDLENGAAVQAHAANATNGGAS